MASKRSRLRQAMEKAQITADHICEETGVHVKTVERWIRGERVPQPRYRNVVANLVGEETYVLWPDAEVPITGSDVTSVGAEL
jgi:transcriptional regulator with XRE-family HTH domain